MSLRRRRTTTATAVRQGDRHPRKTAPPPPDHDDRGGGTKRKRVYAMHCAPPTLIMDEGDQVLEVFTTTNATYARLGNAGRQLTICGDPLDLLRLFLSAANALSDHYLPCGCRVGAIVAEGAHPVTCSDDAKRDAVELIRSAIDDARGVA